MTDDGATRPGPAPDPKDGRWDGLSRALRVSLVGVAALAALALALPGTAGRMAGGVAVAVLVAVPVVRVGWLAQRWLRRGDVRFGLAAVGVVAIVGVAVAIG